MLCGETKGKGKGLGWVGRWVGTAGWEGGRKGRAFRYSLGSPATEGEWSRSIGRGTQTAISNKLDWDAKQRCVLRRSAGRVSRGGYSKKSVQAALRSNLSEGMKMRRNTMNRSITQRRAPQRTSAPASKSNMPLSLRLKRARIDPSALAGSIHAGAGEDRAYLTPPTESEALHPRPWGIRQVHADH